MTRYFYDPSIMKNNKHCLGGATENIHPVIDKSETKKFSADLNKIQNETPPRVVKKATLVR